MSLSAIVVSYRTGPVLSDCLRALAGCPAIDEIILADNGNPAEDEAQMDALAERTPKIRVVRGQGNVGFAVASNLAAAAAAGDVLMFVNPDVVLNETAAVQMLETLDIAPAPALIGGDLRDLNGAPDRGSRRERVTLWSAFVSFSGLARFGDRIAMLRDPLRHGDPVPTQTTAVSVVSGALMMMRRTDFEALGGFDAGYFLHVEDIDLCRRVEEAGGQVLFQPGPHGVHMRSTSEVTSRFVAEHKARSFGRYFRKFARNPIERAGAEIAARVLSIVLPLRARV